jgi:hypothetical protein
MGILGYGYKAWKGYKKAKALKKSKKSKWVKDKTGTITGVKPFSGKIPWYVSASPNTPKSRKRIVKTHFGIKRSDKIDKAVKDIDKGKKTLKHMKATGQAQELKDSSGKGIGRWHRKGFNK